VNSHIGNERNDHDETSTRQDLEVETE